MVVICDCFYFVCIFFFFFKQKTAYEVRISDWSSDVCSSDLILGSGRAFRNRLHDGSGTRIHAATGRPALGHAPKLCKTALALYCARALPRHVQPGSVLARYTQRSRTRQCPPCARGLSPARRRSEEHTSELQSLTRNSYDGLCLKTK